jgi:hypothetical protein
MNSRVQPLLLLLHQARVESPSQEQFYVAARLHQPAIVQHQDTVGPDHAGQAMGYYQRCAPLHQPVKGLLYQCLVFGVHAGKGLIED